MVQKSGGKDNYEKKWHESNGSDRFSSNGSRNACGMWKFRWTPVPSERITDFYRTDFNDKDWKDFPVPANWEINGYGTPIYVSA